MSLKNIIKKSIAMYMALSILFGNCSLAGIGLLEVIAEDVNAPEIKIELENEKYVQYQYTKVVEEEQNKEIEIKGVAIQSNISVYPEYNQDTYMPTEWVEIKIDLPRINEFLPERVSVVESKTKSTTGEDLNKNINQNYDSNSGLLTMSYENIQNKEGNIYSNYNETAKDEFKIIYSYPSEAYIGNDEEVKLNYAIDAKGVFKTENGSVISENRTNIELTEKDNKGDITSFGITKLENPIYKGFLYSNVENKTKYDTEYKTVSTFCILNNSLIEDEIMMEMKENKFILNDEEETQISTNGNVVYKLTAINKYEFDRVLGQDGFIEFYLEEEGIARVSYIEVDEKGSKKLAVIYSEENIVVLNDEDTTVVVNHPEKLTELKVKMSKPVTEGFIHFENQNVIKASEDYDVNVNEIKYISSVGVVNEVANNTKIELREPKTKVTVNSSNTNFSTLQKNKTTLTINLDSTNASTKLFDNPVITVELPYGLTGGNLSSPTILNGNGLEIEDAKTEGKIITIELKGKQTKYDLNNVSGGTTIVMDIENLDFRDTLPTHEDKISVSCKQGKEITKTDCIVNIVSKSGLLMISNLSNYDEKNNSMTTMDSNLKVVQINDAAEAKEVVHTLSLVNNYDENLSNVQLIGKIDYSNNSIKSTFGTELKEIKLNDNNAKVYYSTNVNATYEDDSWSGEYTKDAKAIKVVLDNNEFNKATSKEIKTYFNVPANIGFNQENYINWTINYTYSENTMSEETTLGLLTEKDNIIINTALENEKVVNSSNIEVTLKTYGDGYGPQMTGEIRYNTDDIVEYVINVKNITQQKLSNINVEYNVPEVLQYVEGGTAKYNEFEGYLIEEPININDNNFKYNIKTLKANQEIEFVVRYIVQDLQSVYSGQVITAVNATVNNDKYQSNSKTIQILQSAFKITLSSDKAEKILKPGDEITYTINVTNVGKTTGGVEVIDNIPSEIEITKIEYGEVGQELETIITASQEIKLSESLEEGRAEVIRITGIVREKEVEEDIVYDIVNVAKLLVGEKEVLSNEIKNKIEFKAQEVEDNMKDDIPEVEPPPKLEIDDPKDMVFKDEENNSNQDSNKPEDEENNNNQDTNKPEDEENNMENDGNDNPTIDKPQEDNKEENTLYSISGTAWIDANKDGKKDENEKLLDNVTISLINKDIGNFAVDANGNRIKTTTDNQGKYTFNNIPKGSYMVLFEFDTNTYTVSTYKKVNVEENINSDVILTTVTIDGTQKIAAVTDTILLDSNKEDIDMGLVENAVFDLSLNKQITKVTVVNSKGTEVTEYEEGDIAKVDLVAKYMNGADVIVNYKFTITNEGDVTGYVDSLVDDLPSGLEFSSELNTDWYKGTDGKIYTTALSEKAIKPGESIEIELVLTKNMTEENTGVFPNSAKLEKVSNLENITETENATDNNQSSATLIISIKTGSILLYTGITMTFICIIAIGAYLIKKKVLHRGI